MYLLLHKQACHYPHGLYWHSRIVDNKVEYRGSGICTVFALVVILENFSFFGLFNYLSIDDSLPLCAYVIKHPPRAPRPLSSSVKTTIAHAPKASLRRQIRRVVVGVYESIHARSRCMANRLAAARPPHQGTLNT